MRLLLRLLPAALLVSPLVAQAPQHPLDGLSAREHWVVYDVLLAAGKTDSTTKFAYVGLHEPPKSEVLAWKPGMSFRREALVHLVSGAQALKGYEAIVDLGGKKLLAWKEVPGRQYMSVNSEEEAVRDLMLHDKIVLEGLRKRGITDLNQVFCFPQNEGYFDLPEERGHRLARAVCVNGHGSFSGYGIPIEGILGVVDLAEKKLIRVTDTGAQPEPSQVGEHDPEAVGPMRAAPPPIAMVQSLGPSFTLRGNEVSWQNWKFHFRVDPRRGIVLSLVKYTDAGRDRSVLYQGSLSELFVPYMDPAEPWGYQGYFDLGSYPSVFGGVASSLEPGLDCPSNATYFDAVVVSDHGNPFQRPRAACLFERYSGDVSWRHARDGGRVVESRPRRDLVLRLYLTAGNYDYLFDWVFQQNGTLGVNVGATGMDQVKGVTGKPGDEAYGRMVAPNLIAVNHSHFISFRLDMDVDGTANTVMVDRLKTERLPETNPRRSIWKVESTPLRTEQEGLRPSAMHEPESWRVVNPGVMGAYGSPVAYEIASGHSAETLLSPDDYLQRRAGFTAHPLWVTPYNADELFVAGDYPSVSTAGEGLPKWTAANRSVANTDVVLWVTLGFHHLPRPEDWPVMGVAWHGFELRPAGFFARNPAIDLPKTP